MCVSRFGMQLPHFVQIEPVGQCNLRCQMCPIQFRHDGPSSGVAFMAYDEFTRLIDQFVGVSELHLQGLGEPMMHPRLFDMIAYAAGKGIGVTSTSNLTLLSPRRAEQCVRSGLTELNISVDSAIPEIYERIRVGARFERVAGNIGLLIETRGRLGSQQPRLKIVAVLMKQTLDGLPDLVRQVHAWSIPELFVQHLCHDFAESSLPAEYRPMREFVDEQTLTGHDSEHIERVFCQTRAVAEELGIQLRLPSIEPNPHPPGTPGATRCDWPWARAYVSYQGLAMPCCTIATPDRFNFGNMTAEGVESIWNGAAYEAFRAQLSSEEPPEICRTCSVYHRTF
jgi:radical SAM protein with 4Fe4S-binding SPASM domain